MTDSAKDKCAAFRGLHEAGCFVLPTPFDEGRGHLAALSSATDIPVNADFEGGFADAPEGVATNVTRAVATGIAGLSIENSTNDKAQPIYERGLAVARI